MSMRPVLSSLALSAMLVSSLFVGCAKEEPAPPTVEPTQQRTTPPPSPAGAGGAGASSAIIAAIQDQDVNFDFDKYDLRPDARAILDRKVSAMNQAATVRAQIEGHCDERGTNAYNLALGERRANSAKQYMVTAGISAGRLSTISYGEERPLDPGHNEAAWARNRRAHFAVTGQ